MLLKSLKLQNFRQFIDEEIIFSQERSKNVTIIIGENGTGKTTFQQSFFWCLYGQTSFKDKIMLNKKVASELLPNTEAEVRVTLSLKHGDQEYIIIRAERYKKTSKNRIEPAGNAQLVVGIKQLDGQTTYVKSTHCDAEVNKILPQELSQYFFFDGERIEKMSRDLVDGRKNVEFASAVKGLLGLNALTSAIKHLSSGRNSVIGNYEEKFNAKSHAEIRELATKITQASEKLEKLVEEKEETEEQISKASARKNELKEKLKTFSDSQTLQEERERKEKSIELAKNSKFLILKEIISDFNRLATPFFTRSLLHRAHDVIDSVDLIDKDIPEMSATTIEFLLEKKECICGTPLEPGTASYDTIHNLIQYLPPESIGVIAGRYNNDILIRSNEYDNIEALIREKLAIISQQDEEIIDLLDDISAISDKLGSTDVSTQVRAISNEIQICDSNLKTNNERRDSLIGNISLLKKEIQNNKTRRHELALMDDTNKQIGQYISVAQALKDQLSSTYSESESQIRTELEKTINDIFRSIYKGGMSLTIDDKYNVNVYVDDYDSTVETSTAQSISVIFAFITGVIKLARENQQSEDPDKQLLSSEPYPLVMDAPLSSFDKKRIESVCSALPKTAEQVIIFIKDLDGEIAEEHMGEKVGLRYGIEKIDEFETHLFRR